MTKIDSVDEIKTDIDGRTVTFVVSNPDVDYKAELAKHAETNTHLADYTIQ